MNRTVCRIPAELGAQLWTSTKISVRLRVAPKRETFLQGE